MHKQQTPTHLNVKSNTAAIVLAVIVAYTVAFLWSPLNLLSADFSQRISFHSSSTTPSAYQATINNALTIVCYLLFFLFFAELYGLYAQFKKRSLSIIGVNFFLAVILADLDLLPAFGTALMCFYAAAQTYEGFWARYCALLHLLAYFVIISRTERFIASHIFLKKTRRNWT